MDYVVTAGLAPPAETTGLDGLRREGVAAVLDRQLAGVEGVEVEDDTDIEVLDYQLSVRTDGADVVLALDAPSLPSAEEAAATVLGEVLADSELLTEWSVTGCQVQLTEDEFNESLAAADEEELPADLADAEAELAVAVEQAMGQVMGTDQEADTEQWRGKLVELAAQLGAFDLGAFGGSEEESRLAAGAVVHAVQVVTDELFYDELALAINDATVADASGLLVLEELPECYAHRYDAQFARALLLASASVASRLAGSDWSPPRCVGEALALRLFLNQAQLMLEAIGLVSRETSEALMDEFGRHAFADYRHEELYEVSDPLTDEDPSARGVEEALRERGLAFDQWFSPTDAPTTNGLHPYLHFLQV